MFPVGLVWSFLKDSYNLLDRFSSPLSFLSQSNCPRADQVRSHGGVFLRLPLLGNSSSATLLLLQSSRYAFPIATLLRGPRVVPLSIRECLPVCSSFLLSSGPPNLGWLWKRFLGLFALQYRPFVNPPFHFFQPCSVCKVRRPVRNPVFEERVMGRPLPSRPTDLLLNVLPCLRRLLLLLFPEITLL